MGQLPLSCKKPLIPVNVNPWYGLVLCAGVYVLSAQTEFGGGTRNHNSHLHTTELHLYFISKNLGHALNLYWLLDSAGTQRCSTPVYSLPAPVFPPK